MDSMGIRYVFEHIFMDLCKFFIFYTFSTPNQKFINIFATSLLSSGSKNLVNAFGSRSKKYRKTKNYQKSMKMCSNTYRMPVLSTFGLLTPLLALLGTVNVQNPLILADFGRSYAFTSEAFICKIWKKHSQNRVPGLKILIGCNFFLKNIFTSIFFYRFRLFFSASKKHFTGSKLAILKNLPATLFPGSVMKQ